MKIRKRWLLGLLVLILVRHCVLASETLPDIKTDIGVSAKYLYHAEGRDSVLLENGMAEIALEGGITVRVTGAPLAGAYFIIVPISKTETEAWTWVQTCLAGQGIPIYIFDIYFLDSSGNRINADGAVVTLDCSYDTGSTIICSLTTEGEVQVLDGTIKSGTLSFLTNGSNYYVIAAKEAETEPETNTEQETETAVLRSSAATGDESRAAVWSAALFLSAAVFTLLMSCSRKRRVRE